MIEILNKIYALVASGYDGLVMIDVIDLSDPYNPEVVSRYYTGG